MNLLDYRLINCADCHYILLNDKHKIEEFQKAIDIAKEVERYNIQQNGDDWLYISKHLQEFDFYDIDSKNEKILY